MLFLPDWTGELERIAPAPKDKSVSFILPDMKDAVDAFKAASRVLTAVSELTRRWLAYSQKQAASLLANG